MAIKESEIIIADTLASLPATAKTGVFATTQDTDKFYVYKAAGWTEVSAAGGGGIALHGAKVYNSTYDTIADTTTFSDEALTFNTTLEDTDGYHDLAGDTTKLIIPSGLEGYYFAYGWTEFLNNGSGASGIHTQIIHRNSSGVTRDGIAPVHEKNRSGVTRYQNCFGFSRFSADAGDSFQIGVWQNTGSNMSIRSIGFGIFLFGTIE